MPHSTINDGQVDDMIKNYPALTVKAAQNAMRRAGFDPTDPALAMKMIGTEEFKIAAADMVEARGDENAIRGQLNRPSNLPDTSGPLGQRKIELFEEM